MKSLWGKKLAVALLSVGGAAGAATLALASPDKSEGHEKRTMQVIFDGGAGDRLEIADLDQLQVGESRSYVTDSGRTAVVSRDEKGFEVDLDGKKIRIGDDAEALAEPGTKVRQMKRIEIDGDGHGGRGGHGGDTSKSFVITDDPDREVIFIEGAPGEHGAHPGEGAHGFRFEKRLAPPPPFVIDGLVARLEKNEKFLSLDDATQQLVREAIRESAPDDLHWVGVVEPGTEGGTKVIVRERVTKEDEGEEK